MKSALTRLLRAYPFVMVRIRPGSLVEVLFIKGDFLFEVFRTVSMKFFAQDDKTGVTLSGVEGSHSHSEGNLRKTK
jgi:hypothetical protein